VSSSDPFGATPTAGKVALITGASRGIGAATARLMAEQGWDICVGYRVDAAEASRVASDCKKRGVRALPVAADVADATAIGRLFEALDREWPGVRLGALVNCAGIVVPASRLEDMDAERLSRLFSINVIGSFLCAGAAVRRMSTRYGGVGGVIVNVSSAAARLGSPGEYVDYAATKGAIDTMTIGLAKEVAAENIRVVGVRPGVIDTDIHASGGQPDRAERVRTQIPMLRVGQPHEVAATIAWLCSEAASYVTGSLVDVSGGRCR
jgi:NAD(P)-dependent dehydrogenase (short-subunit alcohol dehydrogenase family)